MVVHLLHLYLLAALLLMHHRNRLDRTQNRVRTRAVCAAAGAAAARCNRRAAAGAAACCTAADLTRTAVPSCSSAQRTCISLSA
jgi:hypothetical protein